MKRTFVYSFLFTAIAFAAACAKHAGDFKEKIPAAFIMVDSPLPGAVYSYGDTVAIKATAISSAVIHGYDLTIKAIGDTTTYYFKHVHDHNDTLAIEQKWKNTLSGKEMEVAITVALDHEGNAFTKRK